MERKEAATRRSARRDSAGEQKSATTRRRTVSADEEKETRKVAVTVRKELDALEGAAGEGAPAGAFAVDAIDELERIAPLGGGPAGGPIAGGGRDDAGLSGPSTGSGCPLAPRRSCRHRRPVE